MRFTVFLKHIFSLQYFDCIAPNTFLGKLNGDNPHQDKICNDDISNVFNWHHRVLKIVGYIQFFGISFQPL